LKYRFLYHQKIGDYSQLKQYVDKEVEDCNNRPHHELHGAYPHGSAKGRAL
jgi:hypothetical protein